MSRKTLEYYKSLEYSVLIRQEEMDGEKWFVAYCNELGISACRGIGNTQEEALIDFKQSKDEFIEILYEREDDIPEVEKIDLNDYSGIFTVRTSPFLHERLVRYAKTQNLSLNAYVNQKLAQADGTEKTIDRLLDEISYLRELIVSHIPGANYNGISYDNSNIEQTSPYNQWNLLLNPCFQKAKS